MHPRLVLPPHAPGLRIGLFGGTFDPPHAAHLGASLLAMKRLKLDRMWWLVTPGNPLKDTRGLRPLELRMAEARKLASHPRIDVTGLEAVINTRYTYDTLEYLVRRCPGVRFVWVMGADNLRSFYRWQNWRGIANLLPMAVVDRMGSSLYATGGRAAQALARYRLPERLAPELAEPKAAGLALSARTEIPSVLNRAPRAAGNDRRKRLNTGGQRAYLMSRGLGDSEA